MIFIEVDDSFHNLISDEILQNAAEKTLQLSRLENMPSLSIKITGNQEIQELNASYRGLDEVTDVLSFEADYFDPDLETHYLGDVVISYPQAADQAEKRGHPAASELQLLVIHGVLHLLGYDHGSSQDQESMWKIQKQALDELGLNIQIVDEDAL